MSRWRFINNTWCNWPSKPVGLIEFIGGSYLSVSPHISYKYLLDSLRKKEIAIHAWNYLPSFDHQTQANEAWKNLRICKKELERRVNIPLKSIRVGHSLGCKLHLLSPDKGRNCNAFISLSFNNFNANRSIPFLGKISKNLKFQTEFSPSPKETMDLILKEYSLANNLLIKFSNDEIDQSSSLLDCLQSRENDLSSKIELKGDHLTPVNSGIRKNLPGELGTKTHKIRNLKNLVETIYSFSEKSLSS